jgi:hypothetical protein
MRAAIIPTIFIAFQAHRADDFAAIAGSSASAENRGLAYECLTAAEFPIIALSL